MAAIFDAHPQDRLQIFIDGQNLHGTLRALDHKIDFKSLIDTVNNELRLIRAQYFTTTRPTHPESFFKTLDFLETHGYTLVTKTVRDAMDENGNIRSKGTMLTDIAAHMVEAAHSAAEHIVLFSGDGELVPAVHACKRVGCRVTVVSSMGARVINDELRHMCDHYVDLADLPPHVFLPSGINFREAA